MKIKELFRDDINRQIEGVIKAADTRNILSEMDEFVVTKELQEALLSFFRSYTNPKVTNTGAWIAGFFGTGKSHLLKILSYALANQEIEGRKTGEIFREKIKEDFELDAAVLRALNNPTETILFNIDEVANQNEKDKASVLQPFKKVFDRKLGLSESPHIARFERDLIKENLYDRFREVFREIAEGNDWESVRERHMIYKSKVEEAFARVTGNQERASNLLGHYRNDTVVSVEEFAREVKEYIDSKGPGFRLVFLADEVGQFIAHDIRIMLNLQTLVETLSVECNSRVWVVVTAQDEVTALIKNMSQADKYDFSRVQARFYVRLNLSSHNVEEVIQKRLLRKTDTAGDFLVKSFEMQRQNITTLLSLPHDSKYNVTYKGSDNFAAYYPFIPYQVSLYQAAITSLSNNNSFSGNYTSVGARSLLNIFQFALQKSAEKDTGNYIPFDLFYEGTEALLKSNIKSSIAQAQRVFDNPLAIRLIKTLFMLKYVSDFKCTVNNLAIILAEDIDQNRDEFREGIRTALESLITRDFVQEVDGVYIYQSDEEQTVVNAINNTELNVGVIRTETAKIIYEEVYSSVLRLKHINSKTDFDYSRKIDWHFFKTHGDIAINVITGFEDESFTAEEIKTRSLGLPELFVYLGEDYKLKSDIALYIRTDRYLRINETNNLTPERKRIIETKLFENRDRRKKIISDLKGKLTAADFYYNGRKISPAVLNPQDRMLEASQELIEGVYYQLGTMKGNYSREDVERLLKSPGQESLLNADDGLNEVEKEIFNFLTNQSTANKNVSVKQLTDYFKGKPYGWNEMNTMYFVASLFLKSKVRAIVNYSEIDNIVLAQKLTNLKETAGVVLQPVRDISPEQIAALRRFYFDYFDKPLSAADVRAIYNTAKDSFTEELNRLNAIYEKRDIYPFVTVLEGPVDILKLLAGADYEKFFDLAAAKADAILNFKQSVIIKILNFFSNTGKNVYDRITAFLRDNAAALNLFVSPDLQKLREFTQSKEPYNFTAYNQLLNLLNNVESQLKEMIENEKTEIISLAEEALEAVTADKKIKDLSEDEKSEVDAQIQKIISELTAINDLPTLRLKKGNVKADIILDLNLLADQILIKRSSAPEITGPDAGEITPETAPETPPVKQVRYSNIKEIKPVMKKTLIENESDVEEYIGELKKELLKVISSGNRIITG